MPGQPVHEAHAQGRARRQPTASCSSPTRARVSSRPTARRGRTWSRTSTRSRSTRFRSSSSTTSATCPIACRSPRSIGLAIPRRTVVEATRDGRRRRHADVLRARRKRVGSPRSRPAARRTAWRRHAAFRRALAEHVGAAAVIEITRVSAGPLDAPVELARLVPPGELGRADRRGPARAGRGARDLRSARARASPVTRQAGAPRRDVDHDGERARRDLAATGPQADAALELVADCSA